MRNFIGSMGLILCSASLLLYADHVESKKQLAESVTSASGKVSSSQVWAPKASDSSRLKVDYVKAPLTFEPNVGQTSSEARFLAHGNGYTLFLTSDEAVIKLGSRHQIEKSRASNAQSPAVVRMKLLGASKPSFQGQDQLPSKSNYFIGKAENWHSNVPNYRQVRERGIYPGIDLVYYGTQRQLEYDFAIGAGTDPSQIQWNIDGAKSLSINPKGDAVIHLDRGDVLLRQPVAYQLSGADKQYVTAKYVKRGERDLAFSVTNYDRNRDLVIDPILSYSTYLGGSGIDTGNSIAVAPDGTAFVAGSTFSTDFPTAHPLQANDGGNKDFPQDAFVAKLSADGSTLLYSTYLGGSAQDSANGIAVDNAGEAYVVGFTDSADFPVTFGAANTLCGSDGKCGSSLNTGSAIVSNGFLTKLNPEGSAIVYSTYIGEYENVNAYAVSVDANEIAYVTGSVGPYIIPNEPTNATGVSLAGAPGGIVEGGSGTSATVTTSAPSGVQLGQYVTISGVVNGANPPVPVLALDGSAFVIGITNANTFTIDLAAPAGTTGGSGTVTLGPPPFPNTTNQVFVGGSSDAFVVKISATGTTIEFATYLGGSNEDKGFGIATDTNGNAYVTGLTYSPDFPVTVSAFQPALGGQGDAFVAQVNTLNNTTPITYASYLGGTGLDQGNGIAVDAAGNAYVAGGTASTGLPTTGLAYGGEGDAFIAKFNPAASGAGSLVYFTYLGGSLADTANAVAVDSAGNAYVTGATVSTDFPTTSTGFQATYGGGNDDAFVAKINPGGTALVYSSYLGGTNTDIGYGISVDTTGAAYVAGQTCSTDFPVNNAVQQGADGNCDAFISKVSILNGVELHPSLLSFSAQSINTTSAAETVTLTNGDTPVTISSVTITGPNASSFADNNGCPSSLAAGQQCVISVTFTPTTSGVSKANLTIADSAPGSPQVVPLTGQTSTLMLSASSLTFGNTPVGSVSSGEGITATNTGTTPITFTSIVANSEFQANGGTCTQAPLQPGNDCVIGVTFTPITNGTVTGSLTINDNAPGSPQIVTLTGTGFFQSPDFSLNALTPSATVSAGQSATYGILVTAEAGFNQPVSLSCASLPPGVSCSFSPNPVTPTANGAQVAVRISTTARTLIPPSPTTEPTPSKPLGKYVLPLILLVLGIFTLASLQSEAIRGRRATVALALVLLIMTLTVACSGGTQTGSSSGTPAGTYQIAIVGNSGSSSHTVPVTLGVK